MPGLPIRPPSDEIWMIRPPPWSRRRGIAAFVTYTVPKKFVSICRRKTASVVSSSDTRYSTPHPSLLGTVDKKHAAEGPERRSAIRACIRCGHRASPLCLNRFQNRGTTGCRPLEAAAPRSRADPTPKLLVIGLFGSTSTPAAGGLNPASDAIITVLLVTRRIRFRGIHRCSGDRGAEPWRTAAGRRRTQVAGVSPRDDLLATAARAQTPIAACATPDQVPALAIGTPMPGSIWAGPLAEGRTSMSKISVGMYTVEHEFGISTTPDSLPSIGAEPKIM